MYFIINIVIVVETIFVVETVRQFHKICQTKLKISLNLQYHK